MKLVVKDLKKEIDIDKDHLCKDQLFCKVLHTVNGVHIKTETKKYKEQRNVCYFITDIHNLYNLDFWVLFWTCVWLYHIHKNYQCVLIYWPDERTFIVCLCGFLCAKLSKCKFFHLIISTSNLLTNLSPSFSLFLFLDLPPPHTLFEQHMALPLALFPRCHF